MAIKGSLREASLADVCQLLAMGQKTGCLSVADGSRLGQICFDGGRISYARVYHRQDRLGEMLVRDGLVTRERLDRILQLQEREPDRRIGDLLVSGGYLQASELRDRIREQVEESVYHLLTWTRGTFYFDPDSHPADNELSVSIDPGSLLLEAARRIDEWSVIEKKIPSLEARFTADPGIVERVGGGLTEEQRRIVPLLRNGRSVAELVAATGLGDFDVGKALYGLVQAGIARRAGGAANGGPGSQELEQRRKLGIAFYQSDMLGEATREFRRVLHLNPDDYHARYHLALIEIRQGHYRRAVRQLRALLEERGPAWGPFMNLALALRCIGRHDDALAVLDEADELKADAPRSALARGATLLDAGRFADAECAFDRYVALLHDNEQPVAEYYYSLALLRALTGRLEEARAAVDQGLALYPDAAPLLLLDGAVHERNGALAAADHGYRQALAEDMTLPQAHRCVADMACQRGEWAEALERYARAVELNPRLGRDMVARMEAVRSTLESVEP